MADSDWFDYVPYFLILGIVGLGYQSVKLSLNNNDRIYENASSVTDLTYHMHYMDRNEGTSAGLPRNTKGELLWQLDGIRGWY